MNKDLERIQNYLGKKLFNRMMEALKIIGYELPEDAIYSIKKLCYYNSWLEKDRWFIETGKLSKDELYKVDIKTSNENVKYSIILDTCPSGNFKIIIETKEFKYWWYRYFRYNCETFEIDSKNDKGKHIDYINTKFCEHSNGLLTSTLEVSTGHNNNMKLESKITSVSYKDNWYSHDPRPIGEYYELFKKLLTSNKKKKKIPSSIPDEEIQKILEMFKKPIEDLQKSLTNRKNLESRFAAELNNLKEKQANSNRDAKRVFDNAENTFLNSLRISQKEYNEGVEQLEKELPQFKTRKRTINNK